MKIWAISNQKGGVGKTTTVVTLGGLLSEWGFRSLLVDLDPHGSLTGYFRYDPSDLEKSIYDLFEGCAQRERIDPSPLIKETGCEGMSLLPASIAMATLDRQGNVRDGMGLVIAHALQRLVGRFDYVLIDTPPMLGVLMINAMAACQHLIIPVQTDFLALKGLERMLHTLTMVTRASKAPLPYTIMPTMFDRRTRASQESLRHLRERYADRLWDAVVPVDTNFRESSRMGVPLSRFRPNSRGVVAYRALLDMLQQRCGPEAPRVKAS